MAGDDTRPAIALGDCLDALRRRGLEPETIIDVGVATGTPDLYGRFPDAYYILVEPLSHWQRNIDTHLRRLKGRYLKCAADVLSSTGGIRPRRRPDWARRRCETRQAAIISAAGAGSAELPRRQ